MSREDKNYGKIIAIAGNQSTVVDVLKALVVDGYLISYLLNVGPEKAHSIADYHDLSSEARAQGIELIRPATYSMTDSLTLGMFNDAKIDLLISVGWQRLFPKWLLDRLSIGAFGMHGSAEPLPRGRGRSPMVWSILENRERFFTNLFRYDEGVDSGMIAATQAFEVFPWDTIQSLQHKNSLAQINLLLEHLPALLQGRATLRPQPSDVKPTYYPKRVPDDGVIDWLDTAERIHRLVRAVARPYPGAFTLIGDVKVYVWRGAPFDHSLTFDSAVPGEITASFHDNTFVVRCGDFSFYVTEWETQKEWQPRVGLVFENQTNLSWSKLEQMRHGGK